jgi:terminal uridylyltransferase
MVLYFLVHVKQPPVLPNLQRIAPLRPITEEDMMLQGRNVYFFDDVEMLRQEWSSVNFESVGELLIDFFRYFSHDFQFNTMVLSLRAGPLTKESKGWTNDVSRCACTCASACATIRVVVVAEASKFLAFY